VTDWTPPSGSPVELPHAPVSSGWDDRHAKGPFGLGFRPPFTDHSALDLTSSPKLPLDGLAITSLVLGLIGGAVFSLGFGVAALLRISRGTRRGKSLAIAGMSLSLVWVMVLVGVIAFYAGKQPTRSADGSIGTRGQISPMSLRLGDCVAVPRILTATRVQSLAAMPCSVQHNGQVFTILQADPGPYPGESQLKARALADCAKASAVFLGNVPSLLHVVAFIPPKGRWALGDHAERCLLVDREQDITGDIRSHA
jgi:Septum formation